MRQGKAEPHLSKLTPVFYQLPSVGPKKLCALELLPGFIYFNFSFGNHSIQIGRWVGLLTHTSLIAYLILVLKNAQISEKFTCNMITEF